MELESESIIIFSADFCTAYSSPENCPFLSYRSHRVYACTLIHTHNAHPDPYRSDDAGDKKSETEPKEKVKWVKSSIFSYRARKLNGWIKLLLALITFIGSGCWVWRPRRQFWAVWWQGVGFCGEEGIWSCCSVGLKICLGREIY